MDENAMNRRRAAGSRKVPRQAADLHVARKCAILLGIAGLLVTQSRPGLGASSNSAKATTSTLESASPVPYTIKTTPLGAFRYTTIDLIVTKTTEANYETSNVEFITWWRALALQILRPYSPA